ncbi:MAG: glycosyltransferase [Candidatus Rokubacteria bacterium]|nr:glycosyltransferase [Candidatus Rokubacteria bacterium]
MTAPAVSVLMGVHDGEPWVGAAVASVLAQTAPDLELIVVDDGSTDGTPATLAAVRDPRLVVVRQAREGLTRALNRALRLARAPLLARLDADDLALPERLARQREFLDAHPEVGLLGTGAREVDAEGREVGRVAPPADDAAIRRALIRGNPFVHSSVMLRRSALDAAGGYDERLAVAQDYDLWMRLSRVTRLANLAEPLVVRRLVPGRVSLERDADRLAAEARVRWRAVAGGAYPWWCAVFALRPALALALPGPLRRAVRRARLHR